MFAKVVTIAAMASYVSAGNLRSREVYEGAFAEHVAKFELNFKNGKCYCVWYCILYVQCNSSHIVMYCRC